MQENAKGEAPEGFVGEEADEGFGGVGRDERRNYFQHALQSGEGVAESLVGASIGPHALGTAVGYLAEGTDEFGNGHELQTLHAGVVLRGMDGDVGIAVLAVDTVAGVKVALCNHAATKSPVIHRDIAEFDVLRDRRNMLLQMGGNDMRI